MNKTTEKKKKKKYSIIDEGKRLDEEFFAITRKLIKLGKT